MSCSDRGGRSKAENENKTIYPPNSSFYTIHSPILMHSSLKLFIYNFLFFLKQTKNLFRNERTDTVFGQGLQSVMMFQLWYRFDGGCNIKMSLYFIFCFL